jgi:FkbM family methyltransferase
MAGPRDHVEPNCGEVAPDDAVGRMSAGSTLNRLLAPLGFALQRRSGPARATAERALVRLPGLGLVQPRTVIDVGAAFGDWSSFAAGVFPDARFLLVEPLAEFAPFLETRARELPNAVFIGEAAGEVSGTAPLHVHRDLVGTSLRSESGLSADDRQVPVTTIDDLVARVGAEGPLVLKLDVQGAELDVLAGAGASLGQTALVQLETLLLPFYEGAPGLADIVAFMRNAGFVVYDAVDLGYRPFDGALAQLDLLFVPESSGLREHREYATAAQRRLADDTLRELYDRRLGTLSR